MSRIVRWCLANKSVVILAGVLLIVSGAYATTRLNQELLPDISFPVVTITTPVAGAGPDVVDEQVTQPIEGAIGCVGQIESVQSTSSAGFSVVVVEFDLSKDSGEAERELQSALDGVALPEQATEPEINGQSASEFPIFNLSLSAKDGDLAALTRYAEDEVVPNLEEVEGVGAVDLVGGAEKQVQVQLDPDQLKEENLPADAVAGAVSAASTDAPVGSANLGGGVTPVRVQSRLDGPGDLEELPVGSSGASAPPTGAPTGVPVGASAAAPPTGAPVSVASASAQSVASASAVAAPAPVRLGEVADVREVGTNLAGISRTNGEPSLGINIVKETDANTVEVARGVEEALDEVRAEIGADQVTVVVNSAADVEESVSGLVEEALIGAALAILVIFAFLRSLRATLVTAVSLPTSVLAALLFSWQQDLTLNIITLAGLTIAVGRVVDDAIVVLENSYRYAQRGLDPEEAALRGTTEVASAITSSTLTTTAVFLPLAVVGGIVSKFFVPLSLTVALALLASLIVSVTIIPVLVSLFIKRRAPTTRPEAVDESGDGSRGEPSRVARVLIGVAALLAVSGVAVLVAARAGALELSTSPVFIAAVAGVGAVVLGGISFLIPRSRQNTTGEERDGLLVRLYTPVLRWSVRHRLVTLLLALAAFAGGIAAVPYLPVSFFPPSQERLLVADVELASGTSLGQTSQRLRPFEDFLMDDAAVESYQLSAGGEDTFTPDAPVRLENQAQAFINVAEGASVDRTLEKVSEKGDSLYGEGFQVEILSNGPPQGGLEAVVTGGSEKELRVAAEQVAGRLEKLDDVNNIRSDVTGGTPEVVASVDPEQAARAGLSPSQVSSSLGIYFGEAELTSLGDTPVVAGLAAGEADSLDEVRGLPVGPGATVGEVADVAEVASPVSITRADGERAVSVTASITSADTQSVSTQAQEAVAELDLPGGVTASIGGESEDIDESFRNLFFSIIVALALVYLILVVFFGSVLTPLVILLSVPLTTVGAFGALLITNTAISLPSLLGVLLLIGIVVSNAILLVDFAINAREDHESFDDALIAAGRARLRPILMTAFATIFALLPLGLGLSGGGSQLISSSLAITVIGGLVTSTFLTLLVVPAGFSLLESARGRNKRGRG